jgi:hypothetical protein
MSTIFDKTVCLSVTFCRPYVYRQAGMKDIETDGDKNELHLTKRIFTSENYRKCESIAFSMRKWLATRSLPSPLRDGTYLIPQPLLESVNAKLEEATGEYNAAADAFTAEYPGLIEEWKEKLGSHFDADNYVTPNQIRRKFRLARMLLNFSPACPDEIDQREEIKEAILEIKVTLRAGLLELIQRLSNMLGDRKDGKKKGFRSEALEAFTEWVDLLPARLVVDDEQLKNLAEKAKKIMAGKSADELRDLDQVRDKTRAALEDVGNKLQKLLKDMPARAFGFDE